MCVSQDGLSCSDVSFTLDCYWLPTYVLGCSRSDVYITLESYWLSTYVLRYSCSDVSFTLECYLSPTYILRYACKLYFPLFTFSISYIQQSYLLSYILHIKLIVQSPLTEVQLQRLSVLRTDHHVDTLANMAGVLPEVQL